MTNAPQPTLPGVKPPAYVSFSAEIVPATTESLIATMSNLVNDGCPQVTLLLSTPGGNVMNGINLYNFLRGLPITLVTHNVGNVDSIGNAIFLAGQPRYACRHSTFMFHGVGFDAVAGQRLDEKLVRERLQGILSDQSRIGSILKERTRVPQDEIESLFREAKTMDAAQAAGFGIIDEVCDVNVLQGCPIISLVFKR